MDKLNILFLVVGGLQVGSGVIVNLVFVQNIVNNKSGFFRMNFMFGD